MRLTELLTQIPGLIVQAGPTNKTIAQVTANSRAVQPGGLFVALVGKKTDGHDFIDEAITNGAEVIVTDGRTSDVPAHICVLASPDSHWLKGVDIVIDGGMGAWQMCDMLQLPASAQN